MQELLTMNNKERDRIAILRQLINGTMTLSEASAEMRISERHCRRLKSAFSKAGDAALLHKLRGRASNSRCRSKTKTFVCDHARRVYTDFGPTLLSQMLEERRVSSISRETLRRWLLSAGLWQRVSKGRRYRKRRPRRSCIGDLLQSDGSHHDCFEGRGPVCCPFVFIDDASSRSCFTFAPQEDEHSALVALLRYIEHYGIPVCVYLDRHAVYKPSGYLTQFARACDALGIDEFTCRTPVKNARIRGLLFRPCLAIFMFASL